MIKKFLFILSIVIMFFSIPAFAVSTIGSINDFVERESFMENVRTKNNAPTSISDAGEEHINNFNGSVSYVKTELELPGKAGFDVVVKRSFDSGENIDAEGYGTSVKVLPRSKTDFGEFYKYAVRYYENGDATSEPLYVAYDTIYDMFVAENGTNSISINENYKKNLTDLRETEYSDLKEKNLAFYWAANSTLPFDGRVIMADNITEGTLVFERDLTFMPVEIYGNSIWLYQSSIKTSKEARGYIGNGWSYILPAVKNISYEDISSTREALIGSFYDCEKGYAMDFRIEYSPNTGKIYNSNVYNYNVDDEIVSTYMYSVTMQDEYNGYTDCLIVTRIDGVKFIFEAYDDLVAKEDRYGNVIKYNVSYSKIEITDTLNRTIVLDSSGIMLNGEKLVSYILEDVNNETVDPNELFTEDNNYAFTAVYKVNNNGTKKIKYNISERAVKTILYEKNEKNNDTRYVISSGKTVIDNIELNTGAKYIYEYSPEILRKRNNDIAPSIKKEEDYVINHKYQLNNGSTSKLGSTIYSYDNYNRQISMENIDDYSVLEKYDASGNLLRRIVTNGDIGSVVTDEYDYEKRGTGNYLPISHSHTIDNGENSVTSLTEYEYSSSSSNPTRITVDGSVVYAAFYYNSSKFGLLGYESKKLSDGYWATVSNTYNEKQKNITKTTYCRRTSYNGSDSSVNAEDDTFTYNTYGDLISSTVDGVTKNYSYKYGDYSSSTPEYSRIVTATIPNVSNIVEDDGSLTDGTVVSASYYDVYGNCVKTVDPKGNETTYTYDKLGRNTKTVRHGNVVTTASYGLTSNYIIETNELGGKKYYTYDSLGRNTAGYTLYPNGTSNVYKTDYICTYDSNNRLIQYSVYSNGLRISYVKYAYYGNGSVKSEKTYNNSGTLLSNREYEYDDIPEANVLVNITRLQKSEGEYIELGEYVNQNGFKIKDTITNTSSALTYTQTYTTDTQGNILTIADCKENTKNSPGVTTEYKYDYRMRQVSTKDDAGSISTEYKHNHKSLINDRRSKKILYTYDERGLEKSVTAPISSGLNSVTRKFYDRNGNLARVEVNNGASAEDATFDVTEYRYDELNRLAAVITRPSAGVENVVKYEYDAAGNILKMAAGLTSVSEEINPEIHSVTTYTYDKYGRCLTETDPMGNTKTTVYNTLGLPATVTDKNGTTFAYTYDGLMRVTNVNGGDAASTVSYTYDLMGNTTKMVDNNDTTRYTYDEFNNLASEIRGSSSRLYTYDANGNITSAEITDGSFSQSLSYTYDDVNRLQKVVSGKTTATYTYDGNSNILTAERTATNSAGNKETITSTYTYNDSNMPTYLVTKYGSTITERHAATYLANGNMSRKTTALKAEGTSVIGAATATDYTYDGAGRLKTESEGRKTTVYGYDSRGNRISKNDGNSTTFYSYDLNNRMTQSNTGNDSDLYTYDNNGNLLSVAGTQSKSYSYDKNNRLIGSSNGQVITTYTYDGNGLRTSKTTNGVMTRFINDRGNVAGEVVGGNVYSYVRGNGLVSYNDGTNIGLYTSNLHGDVSRIIAYGQKTLAQYGFDAFGNENSAANTVHNPFSYCGEYRDEETGLIYLRARYYDTESGRFISEDPAKDGTNWYVYCNGNPVMYVDPDGKIAIQLGAGFVNMLIDTSYLAFTDAIKGEFSSWGEYAGTAIGGFVSGIVSSTPGTGLIGPYVGVVVHSIVKNAVDGKFNTVDILADIIIDSISTMAGQKVGMHVGNTPVSRQQVRKALREAGKAYSGQALQDAVKNAKTKNAALKNIVENITQIVTNELLSNTTINSNDNEDENENIVDEYNKWKTYNDNN